MGKGDQNAKPHELWAALGASAVAAIASFGPYATGIFGVSVSGISTDAGKLALVLNLIAIVLFFLRGKASDRWPVYVAGAASALAFLVVVYDGATISNQAEGLASAGWGLVLTALGSAVAAVAAFLLLRKQPASEHEGEAAGPS